MKNRIDVMFRTADGWEALKVANLDDVTVPDPAQAGVGVLAEKPPENVSDARFMIGGVTTVAKPELCDIVIWWRSCPEAEAQAFELTSGSIDLTSCPSPSGLDKWLARHKQVLDRETTAFVRRQEGKLARHVAQKLAEYRRAADAAHDLKAEKDKFMASMGVSMPPRRKSVAKKVAKKAGKKRRS